jgi:hypothetical protein
MSGDFIRTCLKKRNNPALGLVASTGTAFALAMVSAYFTAPFIWKKLI